MAVGGQSALRRRLAETDIGSLTPSGKRDALRMIEVGLSEPGPTTAMAVPGLC